MKNNYKIIVVEGAPTFRSVTFPVLPKKIEFKTNGTRFGTYNIIDFGEVIIPSGENLRTFKWTSIFPGVNHYLPYQSVDTPLDPKQYQSILSEWKAYGSKLILLIAGTPIFHLVYLKDYSIDYAGAWGDFEYTVEFVDRREIQVTSEANAKTTESKPQTERIAEQSKTYTVVSNDTLWGIAQNLLGDGTRWKEIYNLNQDAIEETAKKYGRTSSENGHWIYPGTTLHIPS